MLIDSIRHSVFCTGPKVKVVENPALATHSVTIPHTDPRLSPTDSGALPRVRLLALIELM